MAQQGNIKENLEIILDKLVSLNVVEKIIIAVNEDDVYKKVQNNKIADYILLLGAETITNLTAPIGYIKNEHVIDFYLFINTKKTDNDYIKLQELQYYMNNEITDAIADNTAVFYHGKLDSIEPIETLDISDTKQLRYIKLKYIFGTMAEKEYIPV